MPLPLSSRIALVTGASSGIGYSPAPAPARKAVGYLGPYAASKAALETLVRCWAQETAATSIRANLFNPGPVRTKMRATVFPGEDPLTLETPEQVAELIVPMCAPGWTETGKLYDYP